MATENRSITKALAGAEDMLVGRIDQVTQNRNGQDYLISGIDVPLVVASTAAVSALDVTKYTRARVYTAVDSYTDYVYDNAATEGLASQGTGKWVVNTNTSVAQNTTDIAERVVKLASIAQLQNRTGVAGDQVSIAGYHAGSTEGGGIFVWDANKNKAEHDGGIVIDPDVVFPSDWSITSQQTTWFTAGVGSGCWVRQYSGDVNGHWFGLKGDETTDETIPLQQILNLGVAEQPVSVFIPAGRFRTTATLYCGNYVTSIRGESNTGGEGTQVYTGGTSIYADHAGGGVLSLKGVGHRHLAEFALEANLANSPKTGLILGRSSASSAGNHHIEKVTIRGAYTLCCIYSIASEEVYFEHVSTWLFADNGGLYSYYCAESDVHSVDSLVTSTNISSYFHSCSFICSSFDADSAVVRIDAGGQTGSQCMTSCYLVANAGSYIHIDNQGAATNILGPFSFIGVNGERLGASGDPTYGLRVTSASLNTILRGLTWQASRFNFQAGATKKSIFIDPNVTLYSPNININPEEAFPYAVADYSRSAIQGGIFSVGREAHWTTATLAGSWANRFGAPYAQAGYKLSPDGRVTLRGEIAGGTGTILTLPVNYRPKSDMRIKTASDAGIAILLIVASTGVVSLVSGSATGLDLNFGFYTN